MARSRGFIPFFLLCCIVLKLFPHAGPATEDVNGLQEEYSLSRELQGGGNLASSSHFPLCSSNLFSGARGDVQYCCCATSVDVADPESLAGYKNSAVGHASESRNDFFLTIWSLSQMSTEFPVRQRSCFWPRGYLSVQQNSQLQTVER